jgi:WD40 repeat protein
LLHTLTGHGGQIRSVAWFKDGRTVATGSLDRTVRFWDAGSGELKSILIPLDDDRHCILSPEGHFTGTPQIERQLVIVVLTDDGRQETLSPAEFEQKYGWRNEPEKVKLR